MSGDKIAKRVAQEADRLELSDIELAALLGVSLPCATALRRRGVAPATTRTERAALAFIERAQRVQSRTDLTLPAA
jgi:hypothetical protein